MRPSSKGGPPFHPLFSDAISVAIDNEITANWSCEVEHVGPNNKITVTSAVGFRHTVVVPAVNLGREDIDDVLEACLHDTIKEVRRRRKILKGE